MTKTANPSCVNLVDVSKTFGAEPNRIAAVRHATLTVFPGELVVLLGPSGSGKTSLLLLMTGLMKPTSGTVRLFGTELESYTPKQLQRLRALRIGFVFQSFHLIDSLTVVENVMVVPRFGGKNTFEAERQAVSLLEETNVLHLARKFPATLSQGEKQRVALARAMANQADLIIADEPTASLDTENGRQTIQILSDHAKERGKCVVVATHDLRMAELADRLFLIEDGVLRQRNVACDHSWPAILTPNPSASTIVQ